MGAGLLKSGLLGNTMNFCGCTQVMGFDTSVKTIINLYNIEAWHPRSLVKDNLQRQGELARRSPLQSIPVEEGLEFVGQHVGGWFGAKLTRESFVEACTELVRRRTQSRPNGVPHTDKDIDEFRVVFDSMDFDRSGYLSLGEWAGGLSVFFKGTTEQCVHAVFKTLDTNHNGTLSKSELQEYLTPFVKAMTPPEAEPLRPLLLKKATDDIFLEMDIDEKDDISPQEMMQWTRKGNNIIDRLADIIEKEVYSVWLKENQRKMMQAKVSGTSLARPAEADDGHSQPVPTSTSDGRIISGQPGGPPPYDSRFGDPQQAASPARDSRYGPPPPGQGSQQYPPTGSQFGSRGPGTPPDGYGPPPRGSGQSDQYGGAKPSRQSPANLPADPFASDLHWNVPPPPPPPQRGAAPRAPSHGGYGMPPPASGTSSGQFPGGTSPQMPSRGHGGLSPTYGGSGGYGYAAAGRERT